MKTHSSNCLICIYLFHFLWSRTWRCQLALISLEGGPRTHTKAGGTAWRLHTERHRSGIEPATWGNRTRLAPKPTCLTKTYFQKFWRARCRPRGEVWWWKAGPDKEAAFCLRRSRLPFSACPSSPASPITFISTYQPPSVSARCLPLSRFPSVRLSPPPLPPPTPTVPFVFLPRLIQPRHSCGSKVAMRHVIIPFQTVSER